MARTINEIRQGMIDAKNSYAELNSLNSTSATAIWRLLIEVFAVAAWVLENLFDKHKTEVETIIEELKPHSLKWYRNKALDFQYGAALVDTDESDYYDNTGLTAEQIDAMRIVKLCAVEDISNTLRVKVAKLNGDTPEPLSDDEETPELQAFTTYMETIKDAGVYLQIVNRVADKLKLTVTIYYDPLVLDGNGQLLSGGSSEPVRDTILGFIKNLPFNGRMVLAHLIDELQDTAGVKIPVINSAMWRQASEGSFVSMGAWEIPFAGYFEFEDENDLTINYIPYV